MFDVFQSRLELKGSLTTITALRVSQGRSAEPIGSDLPVVKDSLGRPLIPGSSFKGAMRSRLESFLRGIDPQLAVDPSELITPEWQRWIREQKAKHEDNDFELTNALWDKTDLVSRVFGSPWMAGKIQICDLNVLEDAWFGQYQERDGVSLDRDTETAADGRLYDFQVVPAGTPFAFQAIVENATEVELGLLAIGLHQFESEQIPLGGGRSRGLGVVKLEISDCWWVDCSESQDVLRYMRRLINEEKDEYKISQETFQQHKQDWAEALINYLSNPTSNAVNTTGDA